LKFRGALAISARTTNGAEAASFRENAWRDTIGVKEVALIQENWRLLDEVYAALDKGDEEFWREVRAERLLLLVGGDEVYRDDVVHMGKTMGASDEPASPVQMVVCPGEVHVQCGMDLAVGIEDGFRTQAARSWLESLPGRCYLSRKTEHVMKSQL
jgi:hypothetical protein